MKKLLLLTVLVALLTLLLAACAKPVILSVYDSKYESTVTTPEITVKGYVTDKNATVWVNDTIVGVNTLGKYSHFATTIVLEEGKNIIMVTAAQGKVGNWKNVVRKSLVVYYSPGDILEE